MFEVIVGLETIGTYASFNEACKRFFDEIFKVIQGGTSYQWLETTNFLVKTSEPMAFMDFYDARDFAILNGMIVSGASEFQEVPELSQETVEAGFAVSMAERLQNEVGNILSMLKNMLDAIQS